MRQPEYRKNRTRTPGNQSPAIQNEIKSTPIFVSIDSISRFRSIGLWFAVWSVCVFVNSSIVGAADPAPADAVPESASVVLRWKTPQATMAKIASYVDAVKPGFGPIVSGSLSMTSNLIFLPKLAGVDVEKDWLAIVFADSEDGLSIVFVIPTTDMKAVKASVPAEFEFRAQGKLALYSISEDAVEKVSEQLGGKGSSLWTKIDASSKKLFDTSDISVLVNVKQLSEEFKDELDEAEPQLEELLDNLNALMPEAQRPQIAAAFDVYRMLGKAVLQGVNDSDSLTVGVTISKDAIRIEDRLKVQDKTETAGFLGRQPPGDLTLMTRLPENKSGYFAAKVDMSGMIDWSMKMTKAMLPSLTEQQKADFDAAIQQMKTLQYGDFAWYLDIDPTSEGALRIASVTDVTPTDRMREMSRSMIKTMAKIEAPGFTQTSTLEPAVVKVGGVDVDRITMIQEIDEASDPTGIQKKIRELLFGEKGIQQLIMYQPKRVLQTFGGGTTEMLALSTALSSTSSNSAVMAARKRMVEKANIIVLVDVARLIANGAKLAIKEGAIPIDEKAIDDLKLSPSFMGFSLSLEPTAARLQFEIPAAQADGITQLVLLVMNARAGQ